MKNTTLVSSVLDISATHHRIWQYSPCISRPAVTANLTAVLRSQLEPKERPRNRWFWSVHHFA